MAASEKQLAEKLKGAGIRLLSPPSSVDELLPILDEVVKILENVEQSPSETMQDALWPTRNALVSQELLGHSDPDVKVSVATCISEITRITAPDAPYSDDQMKEIFQLIVSSFEKLHDMSSRSYDKRTAILDIVAKVRSCVVMLDLECDNLILEMFQHFFNSVRDHHPEKVFSSMETIMTLVLEESEDISPELLSSILETLKKDSKNVDPIARRLGENVLNKCASKFKPYLVQAIKTLEISLDDYSNVVASVCQQLSSDVDSNGVNIASNPSINLVNQVDLSKPSSEGVVKEVEETLVDTAPQAEISSAPIKPESTMSNGNLKTGVEEPEVAKECLSEQKCDDLIENKAAEESETIKDEADSIINPQPEEKSTKKRGRKGNLSSLKPCEAATAVDKDAEVANLQESRSNDSESLHCEDTPADNTSPRNNEKGPNSPHPSSKESENEALDVASPAPIVDTTEESDLKKVDRELKTEAVIQEVRTLPEDDPIKEPEDSNKEPEDSIKEPEDSIKEPEADDSIKEPEADDSIKEPEGSNKEPENSNKEPEADASVSKADKITGQETSVTDKEETSLRPVDASRKVDRSTIDSGKKTTKMSGKKVESMGDQQAEKKTKGQGKEKVTKDHVKSPPKKESKESDSSPKNATKSTKIEASSASSKRKRAAGKEKASGIDKHGKELVGSKIKVWWPKDKEYYEGIVESFDPANKKHRVLYIDGDVELLNMKKERWDFIKEVENSDKGYVSDGENPDASSEIRTKKKIKTNPDSSNKLGNSVSAKKRVGGTSSSRSKVAVSKPGKSKKSNEMNVDKASNDEDSKDGGRSEDEESSDASSGDESMDETPKGASNKSKEGDVETPKTNSKSKQQTPKGNTRSKGKTAKGSASKSNANKTGKAKVASSSKAKESEKTKKSQNESAKSSQSGKSKISSTPSKAQKIETNSGKKRKRGSSKK